ncbi:MAG: AAA family ATPase [Candidatus Coatesbacteria bacterium]|nr:AAA family ATPase [Candidatus Coatesbacteria bacterium]
MGIKIKSLKIRNFRCIGSLDLDFTDPDGNPLDLVVLAGPNGCGKTSVLEAILIACERKEMMVAWAESPLSNVKTGAENFEIRAELAVNGKLDIRKWRIYERDRRTQKLGPMIDSELDAGSELSYPLRDTSIEYLSSWRAPKLVASLPVADEKKDKDEERGEADRLLALQRKCRDFWVHSSLNRHDPLLDPRVRAIVDPLEKVWGIFYPGAEAEFIVRSVSKDNPEGGVNLYLRKNGSTEIPVNDLSSGEIEVLTMAGWFTMNDYKGGIVLIDEPELHMHEEWHCAIMRALRVLLPETQIVVATHSAEILDSVMSYELFWLLHEGDPRLGPNDKPVIRDRPEHND